MDSLKPIEFMTAVEGFIGCHGCVVSHDKVGFPLSMVMEDAAGRQLRLTVTSEVLGGTALKVTVQLVALFSSCIAVRLSYCTYI